MMTARSREVHVDGGGIDELMAFRCHANCIEYARETARNVTHRRSRSPSATACSCFATGSDFPVLAQRRVPDRPEPSMLTTVIDLADAWFTARGRGWSLGTTSWTGADDDLIEAAATRGLVEAAQHARHGVRRTSAPRSPPPDGVEVRVLAHRGRGIGIRRDDGSRLHLARNAAGGTHRYRLGRAPRTPPPHAGDGRRRSKTARSCRAPRCCSATGSPGCTQSAPPNPRRGRGLADLVTRTVTNIGFDGGAPYVTLQASSMGEPIYRRMGYRELYRFANHTRFV